MTKSKKPSRSPGRRRDQAIDQTILKMAIELFVEHGVEGANFEQIAQRTGVSRATIYRRWSSKKQLLVSALRSTKEATITPEAIARMSPGELIDVLRRTFVDALTQAGLRDLVAQLIGSLPAHPEIAAIYREEFIDPLWQAMSAVLDKARVNGALPGLPDRELLRDLLGGALTHRILTRGNAQHRKTEEAWVESLLRQLGLTDPAG